MEKDRVEHDTPPPWDGWADAELEAYLRWRLDDRGARLRTWDLFRVRAADGARHYRRLHYGGPFVRAGAFAWLAWGLQLPLLLLGAIGGVAYAAVTAKPKQRDERIEEAIRRVAKSPEQAAKLRETLDLIPDAFKGSNEELVAYAKNRARMNLGEELRTRPDQVASRAAFDGDVPLLKRALASGASAKARGQFRLMHVAARGGQAAAMSVLLEHGAAVGDLDNDGDTPLHVAAAEGHGEVVGFLLGRGADIEATGRDRWTPLDAAARKGKVPAMQVLLDRGASLGPRARGGRSALQAAASTGQVAAIDFLIGRGASVDDANDEGVTALIAAARGNQVESIHRLLAKGARAGHRDKSGRNAFLWAVHLDHVEAVKALLEAGFDPRAEQDLHVAQEDLDLRDRPGRRDEMRAVLSL